MLLLRGFIYVSRFFSLTDEIFLFVFLFSFTFSFFFLANIVSFCIFNCLLLFSYPFYLKSKKISLFCFKRKNIYKRKICLLVKWAPKVGRSKKIFLGKKKKEKKRRTLLIRIKAEKYIKESTKLNDQELWKSMVAKITTIPRKPTMNLPSKGTE